MVAIVLKIEFASLLRSIFATLARAHERALVHNVRDFPQAKLDSEIYVRFLLNEHGDCMNLNYTRLYTRDLDFKKRLKFCLKI